MIFEGSNGCICFYWDDKLMTSAPLSKKLTLEVYEELSNKLILFFALSNATLIQN